MLRLEQITSEPIRTGLDPDRAAEVRAVRWMGGNAVEIAYLSMVQLGSPYGNRR